MSDKKTILGYIEEPRLYSNNAWMVTFADLISLLLVFFILLYSTSSVQNGRWEKVIDSLGKQFHAGRILHGGMFDTPFSASEVQQARGMDLDYLYSVLSTKISSDDSLAGKITLDNNGSNLVIRLKNADIFDGKTPVVVDDSRQALFTIGESLQKADNKIEIINYIDKQTEKKLSKDWGLALERTITLVGELKKYGNSSNIETLVREDSDKAGGVDVVIGQFVK